jgi:hypothetical protein
MNATPVKCRGFFIAFTWIALENNGIIYDTINKTLIEKTGGNIRCNTEVLGNRGLMSQYSASDV